MRGQLKRNQTSIQRKSLLKIFPMRRSPLKSCPKRTQLKRNQTNIQRKSLAKIFPMRKSLLKNRLKREQLKRNPPQKRKEQQKKPLTENSQQPQKTPKKDLAISKESEETTKRESQEEIEEKPRTKKDSAEKATKGSNEAKRTTTSKKLTMSFKLGQYPYEDPNLIEGVKKLVRRLRSYNASVLKNSSFPFVEECSRCPDFDVCLVYEDKKENKKQCFRRTLEHEPCPELCDKEEQSSFNAKKQEWLDKKKKSLDHMVEEGLIKTKNSCKSCSVENICVPSKENNVFLCIPQRFLVDFDNPCKYLCSKKKKCRILGNQCVPEKGAKKSIKVDVSKYKKDKKKKYEGERVTAFTEPIGKSTTKGSRILYCKYTCRI